MKTYVFNEFVCKGVAPATVSLLFTEPSTLVPLRVAELASEICEVAESTDTIIVDVLFSG